MSKTKWTDELPGLMEGYEEAAPEGLWDAVLSEVTPKRRVAAGWWYGAGSLAAAAAVVLAVFLWKPKADTPSVVPGEALVQVIQEQTQAEEEPAPSVEAAPARPGGINRSRNFAETLETPETPVIPETPETQQQEPVNRETAEDTPPQTQPAAQPETVTDWPAFNTVELHKPQKVGKVKLQVSTGALLAQAGSLRSGYGIPSSPGLLSSIVPTKSSDDITVAMLSRNRASTTEGTHRQSVKMSLGVFYEFAPRWSVGSGVSYTVLRSDYTTLSGTTSTYTSRYLHYLGIPLQIQYNILEWNRLTVSANAGPLFEVAVGAKQTGRSYVGEQLASDQRDYPEVKDVQWSLGAGVGVQYRIFSHGAVFLQPGLSWHIPSDSEVESFYTVHPLSFDFSFGYRFMF